MVRQVFMNRIIVFLKKQPHIFWVYAITTLACQLLAYWLPDALDLVESRMLGSALDDAIPFLPGFIYIYVGAFLFWIGAFAYFYSKNRALAARLLTADLICKVAGFATFCLYPCTLRQPAPEEIHGFGAWLVRLIYASDEPSKLLPSMHCSVSILLALPAFSKHAQPVPVAVKITFPLAALAICASTLFVKQHVFADVWTAAILALAAWFLSLLTWRWIDGKKQKNEKNICAG